MNKMNSFFLSALLIILTACSVEIPTGIGDQMELLAVSGEVASINCVPASLEVATKETGECAAFNENLTRIDINGFIPVVWTSSEPTVVTVSLSGNTTAAAPGTAIITACGTNNTCKSFTITTF